MITWHGATVAKDSHKQLGDEYWEKALTLPQINCSKYMVSVNILQNKKKKNFCSI